MTKKIDKLTAIKEFTNKDWSFLYSILFIFGLLFISNLKVSSQVLINEYFNTNSNQEEWIELIVTEENANLTNLILLDSKILDSSPSEFNGGVQFKNVPFWNSIPKGTFIVIYLKDVDNSLLGVDKVKGRISVKATDESLFEKVCETCDLGDWENEAFVIDNAAELFSIALNSTNIHSLGHTSNEVGHFVNNTGILAQATLSNNLVLSVIPGETELNYFAGYDQNRDFAYNHSFKTVGGANRLSSGTPKNYLFTDNLRIPNWNNPGSLNISKVNNQFNIKWNKVQNLPQPDIYYSFIILLTPGSPSANDLPKNGTNYQKDDNIGNSKVLEVIQGNQAGNLDIITNLNCGTEYTISVILGRFRDLNNNYNQFLSNGISYNTQSYLKGNIIREAVPNFSIFTENNRTTFCIQSDTTITISSDIQNKDFYKFIWFKNGSQFLVSNQFGNNSTLEISEGGQYFLQLLNVDGCIRNSNAINVNINFAPKVDIYFEEKIILNDTTINICKDEEIILKSQSDFGFVNWYKKDGNNLTLVENSFELNVTESGEYLSIANEGDCKDTSKVVTVNILDYTFSISSSIIAFNKYNNVDKSTSVILKNEGNQTLTFNANDISIEAPFKLKNINFPIILEPGEEIEIEILLDTDDFQEREYELAFNNLCNTSKTTKLRAFKLNSEVIVEPSNIVFPERIRCIANSYDTTIVVINNSDFELQFDAKVSLPYTMANFFPVVMDMQDSFTINLNVATNDEGLFRDTLVIYYYSVANTVDDSISIPLETLVYEPYLEINPDTLDIGSLGECIDYVDTTIRLTNIYPVDMKIEDQSNLDIDFDDLPITIPANSTKEIPIRINILNTGVIDKSVTLLSTPCTNDNYFYVKGFKSTTIYSFNENELNFGTIFTCDDKKELELSNQLRITSDDALNTGIDSIYIPAGFKTNLELGQELFNINNFSVTFTPNQTGQYDEYLKIRYYPCGEIDSIKLTGELKEIDFEVPDKIEFDLVQVANNSQKNLIIKNKSFHKLEFEIDNFPNAKFTILNNSNNIELNNYDDEYELELNYLSMLEGADTSYILIRITEPCFIEKEVMLIGNSFPKDVIDINIITTNDLIHNANEELEIKIDISSELYDLDTLDITDVELVLETNSFILNLLNVSYDLTTNVNFDYDIENNLINISYAQLQESYFNIKFQPLVGKGVETNFKIKEISFTSEYETTITYDSLNIELVGICDLQDRQFNIGQKGDIVLSQETLSKINITAQVSNGEKTILNIYDSKGSVVKELINTSVQIGEYNFEINDLPNGVYFISLQNGLEYKQKSFIISK